MSEEQKSLDKFNQNQVEQSSKRRETSLGRIPAEWEVRSLGAYFSIEYGNEKPEKELHSDGYPVYGANGIIGYSDEYLFDEPVITITCRGATCGNVHLTDSQSWVTNNSLVLTNGAKENNRFLLDALRHHSVERAISGSAQPQITATMLSKMDYLSPPLHEQRKIATVLYTVDRAIEKTEEIKQQIERVRDGVSQDVFSRGIRESEIERTDAELKKTYLGTVPEDWQFRRVDEVCSHVVDCPHSTPNYSDQGTLVVRTSEIEDGRYYPADSPRVDEEGYQKRISRLEPKPGDVVFTREAPIGEAFKISEGMELCLGQRLMQLRPEEGVLDADFLVELIYSDMMQNWFERSARGSTSTHVNVGDMESMEIPVPPIEEQQRIVDVLGGFREQLDSERNLLSRYERLKQGLMQDLLSGTVRTTDTNIQVPDEIAQYG